MTLAGLLLRGRSADAGAPDRRRGQLLRRLAANPTGLVGAVIIVTVIAVAALADLVAPYGAVDQIAPRLQGPSAVHWLGTDELGRDELSRVIFGSRISLWVGIVSVSVAAGIGVPLGLVAGYYRGKLDDLIMRVMDVIFAFPTLVLAIVIVGFLGPGLTNTLIAIGLVLSARYARLTRGPVLSLREQEFVQAARVVGAGDARILARHILPNVAAPLLVQASLSLSAAILTEASLSFIGLGAQPPDPSWGQMLQAARKFLEPAPWTGIAPGAAITIVVLGFNQLGDGLRDILDPRLR